MTRKDFHYSLSNGYYKALFMLESNLTQLFITGKKKKKVVMTFLVCPLLLLALPKSSACLGNIYILRVQNNYPYHY